LIACESIPEITQLRFNDIQIWPIIRRWLARQAYGSIRSAGSRQSVIASGLLQAGFKRLNGSIKASFRNLISPINDDSSQARILFVHKTSSRRLRCYQKHYDLFLDPIREKLSAQGIAHIGLEYLDREQCLLPQMHSSHFLTPASFLGATVQAKLRTKNVTEWLCESQLCREAFELFQAQFGEQGGRVDIENLAFAIALVEQTSKTWQRILHQFEVRVCLCACYYDLITLGLMLACSRNGIVSVDVQHGVQGVEHWAYANWTNVPENGYELLPDRFFVWSEDEQKVYDTWRDVVGNAYGRRHVRVIGMPLVSAWHEQSHRFYSKNDVAACHQLSESVCNVLVTFQPIDFQDLVGLVGKVSAILPPHFRWWLRLHPSQLNMSDEQALRQIFDGDDRFVIDQANHLPLYLIIENMQWHITSSSTVVREAEFFGVLSLITSSLGAHYYLSTIQRGNALVAMTDQEISQHLNGKSTGNSKYTLSLESGLSVSDAILSEIKY